MVYAAPSGAVAAPEEIAAPAIPAAPAQPKTMLARMAQQQMNLKDMPLVPAAASTARNPQGDGAGISTAKPAAASPETKHEARPAAPASADGVVLHKGAKSYHRPGCQWYDVNKEVITLEEAERLGVPACGLCNNL